MRVLAWEDDPLMPHGLSVEEQKEAGLHPGTPGLVIGPYDPPERYVQHGTNDPDIWEDRDGVWSRYQPSALLMMNQRLSKPYQDWLNGLREYDDTAFSRRSNFEIEALNQLRSAGYRRSKKRDEKETGGD